MSEKTESALDWLLQNIKEEANDFSDLMEKRNQAAAELAQLKTKEDLLGNLLAILHRDGGHHEGEVGTEQAVKDAMKIYYQLRAELDEARKVIEMIDGLHPDFPVITDFLKAHPERK